MKLLLKISENSSLQMSVALQYIRLYEMKIYPCGKVTIGYVKHDLETRCSTLISTYLVQTPW